MTSRSDLIRLLEAELDLIEGGGYEPPAGHPEQERPIFDHSVSMACINHWEVPGHEADCHDNCVLMQAVPEDRRGEKLPCHHIPLNAAGETVSSIEATGGKERAQEEVKRWLRHTIQRLREQSAREEPDVRY
jgi:hypothetical protein